MGFSLGNIVSFIAGAALTAVGLLAEGLTFGTSTSLVMMGVTMMASAVISATTPAPNPYASGLSQLNTGTAIQIPPSTSNKIPVVYGTAYIGGVFSDLSISSDNQQLYYVLPLCEVTNNGLDTITFGNVYYSGKLCLFSGYSYTSTGATVASVSSTIGYQLTYTGTLSSSITIGSIVTFANTGSPFVYTVEAINTSTQTIAFSAALDASVVGGATMYSLNTNSSGSVAVVGLIDPATGIIDTSVNGNLNIYLYSNGSNVGYNTATSAITVMQTSGLTYKWDNTKLMTNLAFAIVDLSYNQQASITSIAQTQFECINSRSAPGDCLYDYLTNDVYGAAIPASQVDTTSLTALNTYSAQTITFTDYLSGTYTQPRFVFNGVIDNKQSVLQTLQDMTACCDCLLKYNEIYGIWSVIVQTPTYTVAMDINNSNLTGAISLNTLDISNIYSIAECQFPDIALMGSFNTSTLDLATINPSLLYPNEPTNSQIIKLPLCGNNVQAQLLATRMLKESRLVLTVKGTVNYIGLELEAGDVVTITLTNYGWSAKLFRIMQVEQNFAPDGAITVALTMQEYDPTAFNDVAITSYVPPNSTGLSSPNVFGTVPAPTVISNLTNLPVPTIGIQVKASSAGVVQYAEVWYSAYANPTSSQLIFGGTTAISPAGNPYSNSSNLPTVYLTAIPAGNWYFFDRMVNSLGSSPFSPASSVLYWVPTTFQYNDRYLSVAYATSSTGTGFTANPRGMTYYGLANSNVAVWDSNPAYYTWYPANPVFGSSGTLNYLYWCNRSNNLVSFASGPAALAAGSAEFVPTDPNYDPTIWQALVDPTTGQASIIDLNQRTGQLLGTGTTTVGTGEILVTNNPQGQVIASLAQLLSFPGGASQYTSSAATITVDKYGRVVGFNPPDSFYYTMTAFDASSGQTVFSVTRGSEYVSGNCWVFQNGLLLDTSQYTDTGGSTGTVTLSIGANLNDIVTIISFASISSLSLVTTSATGTGTTATLGFATLAYVPFTIGQSITVSGINPTGYNGTHTVTACSTSSVSFASTTTGAQTVSGVIVPSNTTYNSFSRNSATLSNQGNYTASGFTLVSGTELLFLNGTVINAQDYNIAGQVISFTNNVSGDLQIIQWSANNLGVNNGDPSNTDTYTIIGQATYSFSNNPNAFNLYNNGVLLLETQDYTITTSNYTLAQTPTSGLNILVEQTFNRTGAV